MKKLIYLFLTVLIISCSSDNGSSDNGGNSNSCLYTLEVTNITGVTATLNGGLNIVNCDSISIINQGFVYATTIQPTIYDNQVNVNGTSMSTTIENLNVGTTYYARTFLTYDLGEIYGNEVSFLTPSPVYLADNGVTIKAYDFANVGDTGVIDGVTYTVIDEGMLRGMVASGEDVTKVATTKVTDMYGMFNENGAFNQPIGNWDVSNVMDTRIMFGNAQAFNQDISSWDVGNVTDMRGMFDAATSFNQPIGDWNVSNVTKMEHMFYNANSFNQPIGNWDVGNVTDMRGMFFVATSYNQDLSSWSVDNVTMCGGFSNGATSWTLPKPNFTNCDPN